MEEKIDNMEKIENMEVIESRRYGHEILTQQKERIEKEKEVILNWISEFEKKLDLEKEKASATSIGNIGFPKFKTDKIKVFIPSSNRDFEDLKESTEYALNKIHKYNFKLSSGEFKKENVFYIWDCKEEVNPYCEKDLYIRINVFIIRW